jgi:hypothetical protein
MATPVYCTREDVTGALDVKLTARSYRQVDRAVASGTRSVEGLLHRTFRPVLATRYFDWPNEQQRGGRPWRLWLDANEVVSVSALVAGGVTIPSTDYFLEPANYGPPYNRIEIDLASSSALSSGDTHQRAIAVTGVYMGCELVEEQVGDLTSLLDADIADTASATWLTAHIGVGDVLRIDSERMIVKDKTMVDSGQNLGGGGLAASVADVTVPVADGSAFAVGVVLRLDSERMLLVDKAGNNLTVKRAWDGTVLAAHTAGVDVYTLTGVELDRAQLGTTLAAHASGADIYKHLVPGLVRELNMAEAINTIQQEGSGYARRSGLGEERGSGQARSDIEASGRGLDDLREQAWAAFARKARSRAI